jgi:hypothetical protein
MNTDQVRLERRSIQRFSLNLPVSIRQKGSNVQGCGFTQDLSARGALFYTDLPLSEGDAIELTLRMPSEITLTETMRVCCRGKVVRLLPCTAGAARGVAVHLEEYEFLPDVEAASESSATFGRISALHRHAEEKPATTLYPLPPRSSMTP